MAKTTKKPPAVDDSTIADLTLRGNATRLAKCEHRLDQLEANFKKLAVELDTKAAAAVDMLTESVEQIKTRLLKLEPGNISNEPGTGSGPGRSLLDELRAIVQHEVGNAKHGDGAMLREAIKAAVKAELDEIRRHNPNARL